MRNSCFVFFVCFFVCLEVEIQAQNSMSYKVSEEEVYTYERPKGLPFITNFFKDFGLFYDNYIDREHVPYMLGIAASTALTIYYDEDLLIGSQDLGERWNIDSKDRTKTFFSVFGFNVRGPTDFSSGMYFIGDGWTHTSFGAAFFAYGFFAEDYRAWSTGYAIFEGMLTTGSTTQLIKHLTGRESPGVRTVDRGRWRFFPDQKAYHKDVPAYDAYPSGHLATGTMTLTVIAANYPEYWFIKPLGISLLTLLSFQMMNNGVHWASDYPLAIGIGYGLGKVAVNNYRKIEQATAQRQKASRRVEPVYLFNPVFVGNAVGAGMTVLF